MLMVTWQGFPLGLSLHKTQEDVPSITPTEIGTRRQQPVQLGTKVP